MPICCDLNVCIIQQIMATSDPSNPEIDKYGEKQVASEGEKQDTKDNVIETKVEPDHGEQDTNQNAAAIQSKTDVEMQEADAVKENLEEQLEVTDVKAPGKTDAYFGSQQTVHTLSCQHMQRHDVVLLQQYLNIRVLVKNAV